MNWLKKIWQYRKGKIALVIIAFFTGLALIGDFIANEDPNYCKYEGQSYFPIFHSYGEALGLVKPYPHLRGRSWQDLSTDIALYPIIKFNGETIPNDSKPFAKPGASVKMRQYKLRHWLGTDGLGKDVAAGIVQGSRKTLLISFLTMALASLIGFFFGVLSGYFGDYTVKINRWILPILFLGFGFIFFQWIYGHWSFVLMLLSLILFLLAIIFLNRTFNSSLVSIPFDIIVMRMIEIFKSVPALFILLALLALIARPSIFNVILIIGVLRWTNIARVLRAELLKTKAKDFMIASKALGLSNSQILWRHAIPNSIPPLITIIAFGFSGVILLEATISFLGIGLSAEEVTWGSLLSDARGNFSAWWLALFPGLAIFLMVVACNYLGDTLNEINLRSD